MLLGLRTAIYPAPDLDAAKHWHSEVLGLQPYFDEPFHVGFQVGGSNWARGHRARSGNDVGGNIKVAAVCDPFGNRLGIIETPNFDPGAVR